MLDINEFPESLVGYDCVRIRDTRTVWINPAWKDDLAAEFGQPPTAAGFARYFSYVSESNQCFDAVELDRSDRRTYQAERYGGGGVGTNGGGGRVGNFGKFQSKGVGPNPLARSTSTWHSYGSLNLIDAAYEAIYSTVLDRVLPLGCAKIYGIVQTSTKGAYKALHSDSGEIELVPTPGAIIVREPTLRPAHFMHASIFAPPKTAKLLRESLRIRAVHKRLHSRFESDNQFIQFLGKFILASCRQFGFARAARIAHGGVTPSNICLDGRWIDLTEARFLSGGKNFRGLTPFFQEPQVISEVVNQLLYVFGKTRASRFNVEPLMRYMQSSFDSCFTRYTLSLLGFPDAGLDNIAESDDGKEYAKAYAGIVMRDKRPVSALPDALDPKDPAIAFMHLSYGALVNAKKVLTELGSLLRCSSDEALKVATAFRDLFQSSVKAEGGAGVLPKLRDCAIASAVKTLRWAYLSAYFYRHRVTSHLYYIVDSNNPADLGAVIQECIDQSTWIFDTVCRGKVVILQTAELSVQFDQISSVYTVDASGTRNFQHYVDCLAFIHSEFPDLHLPGGFNPFVYLHAIADVLANLEGMQ